MAGFDRTVFEELVALMTSSWSQVVGDVRLTSAKIYKGQSLNRSNWENMQASGQLSPAFGIITSDLADDAGDTPVHWLAARQNVVITFVLDVNDPVFQVDSSDPTKGYDYVSAMGNLIETTRQNLMLYSGSFRCFTANPSTNVADSFLANHAFYQLLDGKFAGHIVCSLLTASLYDPSSTPIPPPPTPNNNKVWCHNIYTFTLDQSNFNLMGAYGSLYSLNLGDDAGSYKRMIRTARDSGFTGFAIDTLPNVNQAIYFLSQCDLVNSQDNSDFECAVTLDAAGFSGTKVQGFIAMTNAWCAAATNHPSAARKDGKFVVFTYSMAGISASDWATIKAGITYPVYWVHNLDFDIVNGSPTPAWVSAQAQIQVGKDLADAYYAFDNVSLNLFPALASVFAGAGKPWYGGMMPSYYRGYGVPNPFNENIDMLGTAHFRAAWANLLTYPLVGAHVSTWNDYTEHTCIDPNSDMGTVFADLNNWYSAIFRNEPSPFTGVELYITTPKSQFQSGQIGVAEALIINGSPNAQDVTVSVSYSDSILLGTQTITVPANSVGAATVILGTLSTGHGDYLRATATCGTQVVVSAPILIFPQAKPNNYNTTPLYYSLRADLALPSNPTLSIVGGVATVTPVGTARFVDVRKDTNMMHRIKFASPWTVTPLTVLGSAQSNDDYYLLNNSLSYGLYVAHEVDVNGLRGFSDPVSA